MTTTPGSPQAITNGCTCRRAMIEQAHGEIVGFHVNSNCPIHGLLDPYEHVERYADLTDLDKAYD